MHARGLKPGLNVGLGDSGAAINIGLTGPSLSYGGINMTLGGGNVSKLPVNTIRNICNENDISCRDVDGKLLTKQKLLNKMSQ
jgi:hypothetical protein